MFSSRSGLRSSAGRRRQRQAIKIAIGFSVTLGALCVGGLLYVVQMPAIRIQHVVVSGTQSLTPEVVEFAAQAALRGTIAYVFPKDNIFYFSRKSVRAQLTAAFPEIKTVDVSFKDLQSITVSLEERVPVALWCTKPLIDATPSEACFLIDREGFSFKKSDDGSRSLPIFYREGEVDGSRDPLGGQVFEAVDFARALEFIGLLKEIGLFVVSVEMRQNDVREGTLSVGGKIIWHKDENVILALENLKTLLASADFKGKTKDGVIRVEYIDIQNSNKIFYKVR